MTYLRRNATLLPLLPRPHKNTIVTAFSFNPFSWRVKSHPERCVHDMATVRIQDGTKRWVETATYPLAGKVLICLDAPCLTCRQKARKCDRARPMCRRCIRMGLQCEGYPDKFRFCGIASRGKWKNQDLPISKDSTSTPTTDFTATEPTASTQGLAFNSWEPPSQNKPSPPIASPESNSENTPGYQEHSKILVSKEAEIFLVHCMFYSVTGRFHRSKFH